MRSLAALGVVQSGVLGLGKTVDYGTPVEQGTVLALIDDALYRWDMEQAAAQVEQAKANELRARADLLQMQAKLHQASRDWSRARVLAPSNAIAASDYDGFEASYETSRANVAVGEAAIAQAHGATVLPTPFRSHAAQRNRALRDCRYSWVLFLDADERLSPDLAAEIAHLRLDTAGGDDASSIAGFWIPRFNLYWGRSLCGGGWYPDRQLRLL